MENNESRTQRTRRNESESSDESSESLSAFQQAELDRIIHEMLKWNSRIKRLETIEVDFDNEGRSSFLELHKCRKKIVDLYYKGCEIKGYPRDAGRLLLKDKELEITGHPIIDQVINSVINEDWFNIPTYSEILECIQFCNEDEDMGLEKSVESSLAELAYIKIVNILGKIRQKDFYKSFASIYQQTEDPAKLSRSLWERLANNDTIARRNLDSVCDEFARREIHTRIATKKAPMKPKKVLKSRSSSRRVSALFDASNSSSEDISTEESDPSTPPAPTSQANQGNSSRTVRFTSFVELVESSPENSSEEANSSELPSSPLTPILEETSVDLSSQNPQNSSQLMNSAPNFAVSTLNEEHSRFFINPSFRINKVRGQFASFSHFENCEISEDSGEGVEEGEGGEEPGDFTTAEEVGKTPEEGSGRGLRDKCLIM